MEVPVWHVIVKFVGSMVILIAVFLIHSYMVARKAKQKGWNDSESAGASEGGEND